MENLEISSQIAAEHPSGRYDASDGPGSMSEELREKIVMKLRKTLEVQRRAQEKIFRRFAGLSQAEKSILEKHDRGEPLADTEEGKLYAQARSKIEKIKIELGDLLR